MRLKEGRRSPTVMRWSFIPSWTKDPDLGSLLYNVRAETVADDEQTACRIEGIRLTNAE